MTTNYKIEGQANKPVLVFSNSLGADMRMWDAVVPRLLPYFRVLRYDTRGMGQSEVTAEPYHIAQLAQDVLGLADTLGIEQFHFCGLSMGGQIGQQLGIHHSERLHKLVLCNTAAKIGTAEKWNKRIQLINRVGMRPLWHPTKKLWFRAQFIEKHPERVAALDSMFLGNDIVGYSNCCAAVRDADFRKELQKIQADTLVITGDEDTATTVADAAFMVDNISMAQLVVLPARHIPSIEQPEAFAKALLDFLVE